MKEETFDITEINLPNDIERVMKSLSYDNLLTSFDISAYTIGNTPTDKLKDFRTSQNIITNNKDTKKAIIRLINSRKESANKKIDELSTLIIIKIKQTISNIEVFQSISDIIKSLSAVNTNYLVLKIFQQNIEINNSYSKDDKHNKNLYLDLCIFEKELSLKDSIFIHGVFLNNSIFNNNVSFDSSEFRETSDFSDCIFEEELSLKWVSFNRVRFIRTKFNNWVNFEGTKFLRTTLFDYAEFKKVFMAHVEFESVAIFAHTKFSENVSFFKTTFKNNVSFNNANFCKAFDFSTTFFNMKASFKNLSLNSKPIEKFNEYFDYLVKKNCIVNITKEDKRKQNAISEKEHSINEDFNKTKEIDELTDTKGKDSNKTEPIDIKAFRQSCSLIKKSLDDDANKIDANKFYALEMLAYEKEGVKENKGFVQRLFNIFNKNYVLLVYKIVNNHGQSWQLALFNIILINFIVINTIVDIYSNNSFLYKLVMLSIILFILIYLRTNDSRLYKNIGGMLAIIFGILLILSFFYHLNSFEGLDRVFIFLIYPFAYFDIITESTDQLNNIVSILYFIKAINLFLIYQLIQALRMNTRR